MEDHMFLDQLLDPLIAESMCSTIVPRYIRFTLFFLFSLKIPITIRQKEAEARRAKISTLFSISDMLLLRALIP